MNLQKDKHIDGKKISSEIKQKLKIEIEKLYQKLHSKPTLGVIIVGQRSDSILYVKNKEKSCKEIGIESHVHHFHTNITENELILEVDKMNNNQNINGILIQLPLPKHINEEKVLSKVSILKDVDGFGATNIGKLAMLNRTPYFTPCTPLGCMKLLEYENIDLIGKHAVVIGRSNIVGLPTSLLLLNARATVTICHIDTQDIQEITKKQIY